MNYTLLLPAFCYSQNNEKPVSDLEERVATVEAKISKQMLKIVSLEKKDNVTLRKTIKITPMTYRKKYLYKLFGWMFGWYLTKYAFIFVEGKFEPTFPHCFCLFTIAHHCLWHNSESLS